MKENIKEKINDLIEEKETSERALINNFFDILFWKNYSEGYVNFQDKRDIFKEIKNAEIKDNFLDTKKILPFVNKIRKQIGLKELTAELNEGYLQEITPEVMKKLIVRGLEE